LASQLSPFVPLAWRVRSQDLQALRFAPQNFGRPRFDFTSTRRHERDGLAHCLLPPLACVAAKTQHPHANRRQCRRGNRSRSRSRSRSCSRSRSRSRSQSQRPLVLACLSFASASPHERDWLFILPPPRPAFLSPVRRECARCKLWNDCTYFQLTNGHQTGD
jgi:hypothetical protein